MTGSLQTTNQSADLQYSIGSLQHDVFAIVFEFLRRRRADHNPAHEHLLISFIHLDRQVVRLPDDFRVDAMSGLAGELRAMLGPDALIF